MTTHATNMNAEPNGAALGRIGSLAVRLATSAEEIAAAQRLRHAVFSDEHGASISSATECDVDPFDACCEHLLVVDEAVTDNLGIVGTYRLIDERAALKAGSFYSATEFDLTPMLAARRDKRLLELGRSCIAPSHRSKRTMELAWHGIWRLVVERRIDTMFGCASFPGTEVEAHAPGLAFLREKAALPKKEDCPAIASGGISLAHLSSDIAERRALASLPPLLKGYLRLGARVASSAVIDRDFKTIDVLVVLDVDRISPRYIAHYGADASRFAA